MSQLDKLYIAATGIITPVGGNTQMTVAAVNAGITAYQASSYCNGEMEPLTMAKVPDDALSKVSAELEEIGITARQARMLQLAQSALEEVLAENNTQPVTLFLAGPEPRANAALPIRSVFIKHLQIQTGIEFDLDNSKVFPMGRAGFFYALESAFQFLENSEHETVLVGGVDSFWDAMTLATLMSEDRLDTTDSFVPGEGAGFILLTKNKDFSRNKRVCRPGISIEAGHRYSEEPYLGEGLSIAFKQAITLSKAEDIKTIYSSLNGESFGNKEYGVSLTRNSSVMNSDYTHTHPADCYGDLGAATGPILITLAAKGNGFPVLCYGSSDLEFRGAACVF